MAEVPVSTKHLVIDLKTGFAFGLKMSADGKCEGAQPLNIDVQTLTGTSVKTFGPLVGVNPASINPANANPLPYGKTTFAVELLADGSRGKLFTIVWPAKAEADKGVMPQVAVKQLPESMIDSGFAARPRPADAVNADEEEKLREALKNIDDMIGLDSAKREIRQNIAVVRFNQMKEEMGLAAKPISRHMVFTGNPGTGKTTFAREVAKVYHALGFIGRPVVHEVKREDLVAGFVGQTALKTRAEIEKAVGIERDKEGNIKPSNGPKGGILFIDEAYALSRMSNTGSNDFGQEAIDTLVAAMENMRHDLIVIVAGYTDPMKNFIDANPGLKSRFMTYIDFQDYGMKDLGKIMDYMLNDRGYVMSPEARELAMEKLQDERDRTKKDFGNGRTVRNLVEMAEKEMAMRLESENVLSRKTKLSEDELKAALTTLTVDDIAKVNLAGLTGGKKAGMSFGEVASRKTNDNIEKPMPNVVEAIPQTAKGAKKAAPAPKR